MSWYRVTLANDPRQTAFGFLEPAPPRQPAARSRAPSPPPAYQPAPEPAPTPLGAAGPQDRLPVPPWYGRWPFVLSYGMGVDSTAVLVLLHASGMRPDLIVFADTGSERPETYAYLDEIQAWLARVGFPPVTVVRKVPGEDIAYRTLEQNCLVNNMLPSLAYGGHMHGCSLKWKVYPIDQYVKSTVLAQRAWAEGGRVVRAIGYDDSDADNERRRRFATRGGSDDDGVNVYYYPLQVAHWDREECIRRIQAAGLPVPPKSACFFCPSTKPWELLDLAIRHPDLAFRIVQMEMGAGPNLETIDGLWGEGVKGTDGGVPRPGSMSEFLLEWMLDGRAYDRMPRPGEAVPFELRRGTAGRVFTHLPVLSRRDESWDVDRGALASLAEEGRRASIALRHRVEAAYGVGSVERLIAEGKARSARRKRLARGRALWTRVAQRADWLSATPRPATAPGDDSARPGTAGRERAKAAAQWDRTAAKLAEDRAELAPLVEEFGRARLAREPEPGE